MPVLSADGENLYITAYSFGVVLQPTGTNPRADAQELFLTVKNPPGARACIRRGTTPALIKPATVAVRGPAVRPGATPAFIKPAKVAGRGPAIKPGTTPRRIKPGEGEC